MDGKSLADLRRLAEAATPGPWEQSEGGMYVDVVDDDSQVAEVIRRADAAFIAAANPAAVLALLDEIERLRAGQDGEVRE